jgi:hypothetical protein
LSGFDARQRDAALQHRMKMAVDALLSWDEKVRGDLVGPGQLQIGGGRGGGWARPTDQRLMHWPDHAAQLLATFQDLSVFPGTPHCPGLLRPGSWGSRHWHPRRTPGHLGRPVAWFPQCVCRTLARPLCPASWLPNSHV